MYTHAGFFHRTSFTLLSNLAVFVTMWVLLNVADKKEYIGPAAEWSFSVSLQTHHRVILRLCQ